MATIVLTALGTVLGGPLGAAVGGLIGNAFDHAVLFKTKGSEGRRLNDIQVQTSTYGAQVPKLFGTIRAAGTVIWATDLKEKKHKSGGGKGRPSVTTYSYSTSFAVAISARPVRAVRRIWADGNLLRGAAGDFKSEVGKFRLHKGTEDQAVDPLIASAKGMARTPAHRGMAYVVFEDLALADFGNRIPSLTFEVEADDGEVPVSFMAEELSQGALEGEWLGTVGGFAATGVDVSAALAPLVEGSDLAFSLNEAGLRLSAPDDEAEGHVSGSTQCRRVNGRPLVCVEQSADGADAVPVSLSLRHHDPSRDYQAGVQRVTRPGPGRLERGIDLPAVLTATEGRAMAARRLALDWSGRSMLTLRCGWEALFHEPGQIVTVEGVSGLWRIEEREWEAMAVRLSLRRVPGAGGALPGGASSGTIVQQADAPHGATTLMLVDLPPVGDSPAAAPVIMAAASGGEGWRSAALFTMSETGEAIPAGRTAPRSILGWADAPLGAASATLIDEVNALSITLLAEDMALTGADEAALGQGLNLCMVGSELLQFSRAVQTGPASFRLEGLRRGLRGTEWAMSSHVGGEPFLLLEEDRLADLAPREIGATMRLSAIGVGDSEPVEAEVVVTGEAARPLAPVHVRISSDGAGGKLIRWTRRSRVGWRWMSGADVPLGEESERYQLRVLADEAQLRLIETSEPAWAYDAAMIAADTGMSGVRQVEIRQLGSVAPGRPVRAIIDL